MKSIPILLLGHKKINKNLGWAMNYFGKFLGNYPPPYSRYFMIAPLDIINAATYQDKALIFIGATFQGELIPHHQTVN